ncbi:ribosomal RNA small subunit methyltransferase A [candidate division KSB1 bacterium]|nr:MAG: ribosomal RNA small subunit methyltransferase A [candidate division KSB1 bacterium]
MNFKGVKAKKYLGQNFLNSEDVLNKIVRSLEIKENDFFIEIGAGTGVLTRELVRAGAQVAAVETDESLVRILREDFSGNPDIEIVKADILKLDLTEYEERGEALRIAGNIPYYITSPILFKILDNRDFVKDATLMIQKEVGERLTAEPGNKIYGIPTVLFNQFADVKKLFYVSRNCFSPRPDVDSVVINISFLEKPRYFLKNEEFFKKLVKQAFGQRRKMLRNTLRSILPDIHKDFLSTVLSRRPEQLTTEDFAALSNELYK